MRASNQISKTWLDASLGITVGHNVGLLMASQNIGQTSLLNTAIKLLIVVTKNTRNNIDVATF